MIMNEFETLWQEFQALSPSDYEFDDAIKEMCEYFWRDGYVTGVDKRTNELEENK